MRAVTALAAVAFVVAFIVTFLATRTAETIADPTHVARVLTDAGLYELAYGEALEAALEDLTQGGLGFEGGRLPDPEAAAVALRGGVETLLPQTFVEAQVREALAQLTPYASGRADTFVLELDLAERARGLPAVVREVNGVIGLGRILSTQWIAPRVVTLANEVTLGRFGVEITEAEVREAALTVAPPGWIDDAVYLAIDAMTPYLAGDADAFAVHIPLRDRAELVGEALEEKLAREAAAGNLVFTEIAAPVLADRIDEPMPIGYGIELTGAEIHETLDLIAPAEWLRRQASRVVERFVAYLTGEHDELAVTFDLCERKGDAVDILTALAEVKLRQTLNALPPCETPDQLFEAIADVRARGAPRCAPEGAEALVPLMTPFIRAEIDREVRDLPDSFTYTDAMFRASLGPERVATLEWIREQVIGGIGFTKRDLLASLGGEGDPWARADIEAWLDRVRQGPLLSDRDLRDGSPGLERLEASRRAVGTILELRYLLYALVFGLLLAVAFAGGRSWRGRLLWAGATLFLVSAATLVAILLVGSAASPWIEAAVGDVVARELAIPPGAPRLTRLLSGEALPRLAVDAWRSLVRVYRNGIVPILAVGFAVALAAMALPGAGRRREGEEGRYSP